MNIENVKSETIIQVEESIVDGVYTRIAYAPANCYILGCEHKQGGTAVLLKGKIKQIDGDASYEISAPFIFNTKPGSQRLAYTLEDTIYATIHSTTKFTTNEAVAELFIGTPQITRIKESFKSLDLPSNTGDLVLEHKTSMYYIDNSIIHGLGLFANKEINVGDTIAILDIDSISTGIKDYINHSDVPNAILLGYKDSTALVCSKQIPYGYEIFINYKELICQ